MRIGGIVKLGDLEYAKKLGPDKTHEFRTVTVGVDARRLRLGDH